MNRPLSFLHVTTFYPPYSFGGDAVFVRRLSHALADAGHRVDVLHSIDAYHVLHPEPPSVDWKDHRGVTTHGLRSGHKWLTTLAAHQTGRPHLQMRRIRAVLNRRRFDVIHFHNVSLFGPGVLTLRPDGQTPLKVYTTHEHWLVCPMHVLWKFDRRACDGPDCIRCALAAKRPPQLWRHTGLLARTTDHVDLFLAPSRSTASMHADRGFDRPFEVLPIFVDAPDDEERHSARPHDRPYFLFVGRLERLKGLDVLLQACALVPDADLLIVGTGADERRLKELASLNPRVHFLGAQPQETCGPLYRHALACCVPSLAYEVFPTVAIESMARRTPVVAHDIGGLSEIVGESGGGIRYTTQEQLVAALRVMIADEGGRREMGDRGYRAFVQRWSPGAHLARYLALLDEAAERKQAAAAS